MKQKNYQKLIIQMKNLIHGKKIVLHLWRFKMSILSTKKIIKGLALKPVKTTYILLFNPL